MLTIDQISHALRSLSFSQAAEELGNFDSYSRSVALVFVMVRAPAPVDALRVFLDWGNACDAPWACRSQMDKALVMELARSEYVERRENIIAVGNSGTGKSHIALGARLGSVPEGLFGRFTTAGALVHELIEARDERRL